MATKTSKNLEYYMGLPYTIRFQAHPRDGWYAEITELEGCFAAADTQLEVPELLEGAKEMWLMIRLERNESIPMPVPIID
ncbi:MAG: type II toxin-antitoxin system HicB family antitoxin [Chloroflexota bacterium]